MSHIFAALPIVLIVTSQGPPGPSPAEKQRFEAAKVEAGASPAKLVKLSLWCESHGMRAEQLAALEEAVRLDPEQQGGGAVCLDRSRTSDTGKPPRRSVSE